MHSRSINLLFTLHYITCSKLVTLSLVKSHYVFTHLLPYLFANITNSQCKKSFIVLSKEEAKPTNRRKMLAKQKRQTEIKVTLSIAACRQTTSYSCTANTFTTENDKRLEITETDTSKQSRKRCGQRQHRCHIAVAAVSYPKCHIT